MRQKLFKFEEIKTFPNVLEQPEGMQGKWREEIFKNDNPIVLELACGKGEYALGLAEMFPDKNFIGVDIKGERIWRGAKTALEKNLSNVRFLRAHINFIREYFAENEIDEIWITFADPFPKKGSRNKRLTAPHFLEKYRFILKPGSPLHLKTDAHSLWEFSHETVKGAKGKIEESIEDIYAQETLDPRLEIKTTFERRHLLKGRTIYYLRWVL